MYKNVEKDESKWNRNIYRKAPTLITPDFHGNSTPSCVNNRHYQQIVRKQIIPFAEKGEEALPVPIGTTAMSPNGLMSPNGVNVEDKLSVTSKNLYIVQDNPANHRKVIDFQTAIISEPEKWQFIQTMMQLCERLSAHFDTPIYDVNEAALYALFAHYSWTCPVSGKVHSWKTPLTIEFLKPVWCGGKIKLSNMRPIYNGWLPGEYRWAGQPTLSEMAAA